MDITHLHLNVRDPAASSAFYKRWFGLQVRRQEGDAWFLAGDSGFLLVLLKDPNPTCAPAWAHCGVVRGNAQQVLDLYTAMQTAGIRIVKPYAVADTLTSFRIADPDGHVVEVYWLHQAL